ncbi:MAG TPA: metal ABC transporter permease [Actinomycetota bacterium]|nr:metal ABC transporter permease [Actinomycetota bacterium]
MSILLEPFAYGFFVSGVVVATLAGVLCGLVGVYVVLRGMSYIGHGLSHAIFGGAVASFVAKVNFYVGAAAWGFVAALLVNRVARRRTIGADAAIGVVTTASFAVGLALISRFRSFTRNFEAALFGNVLGVRLQDALVVGGVLLVAAAFVFFAYRPLLFTTFDPEVAEASGVPTGRIDAGFALLLAATIVATMNILGVLLIAAALVIPAVVARLLTDSFGRMLWLSMLVGGLSGFAGMYLSWYLNVSSGATIVLTQAAFFMVAFALTGLRRRHGIAPRPAVPPGTQSGW